jgi:hypothetical protein
VSFDPGQVMSDVDAAPGKIEQAADNAAAADVAEAEATLVYDRAFEAQLLTIYHEAKRVGERMPAEDVRRAIAHDQMDDTVYAEHVMTKARASAANKQLRAALAAGSLLQTKAKALSGA